MWARRAAAALRALKPMPGDVVARVDDPTVMGEVASISADGRLNYRGGMGAGDRPHGLRVVERASTSAPTTVRKQVQNAAAARRARLRVEQPSGPQMAQLEEWLVKARTELADVQELEAVLESASDERPLQRVLTDHPALLGKLLGGTWGNAVIPWPRLNDKFVPDFMLAEADSAGIHWTLVELESPREKMLLNGGGLAKKAREGVGQVRTWRDYLSKNLADARKPVSEGGLGLAGLRPDKARGLVIIGRREDTLGAPQHERQQLAADSMILVRSYDWLLQMLGAARQPGYRAPIHHELALAGLDLDELDWT
jgi:hypothetical protein